MIKVNKPSKKAAQRTCKQVFEMPGQARTWQEPEESGQSITQKQPEVMHIQKHRHNLRVNLNIHLPQCTLKFFSYNKAKGRGA